MNQAEDQFARRLVGYLDESVNRIEPATRERLLAARKAALARYRERPAPVAGLAWAGHAAARISEGRLLSARHVIAVCALVLALVVIAYWQKPAPVNELADIDTALLSGELPINAYLDKGFDSWLKRSSR
ncbi:MAG TPA: DUF3619 family protein [Burkholderiales bacterium]|nr:DUF3619 family protein [Burkholderiales bacterium]